MHFLLSKRFDFPEKRGVEIVVHQNIDFEKVFENLLIAWLERGVRVFQRIRVFDVEVCVFAAEEMLEKDDSFEEIFDYLRMKSETK